MASPHNNDSHAACANNRPRLLDLFCCAGGAGMGYHRAGFEVVGVDKAAQPRYPFRFMHDDALGHLSDIDPDDWDAIHASPPCQSFTAYRRKGHGVGDNYEDLIEATRTALQMTGLPYVIENVEGAPLLDPVTFCGSSFGLDIRRHRLFESNVPIVAPPCNHKWQTPRFPQATNRANLRRTVEVGAYRTAKLAPGAMGIDWMELGELSQAVPPAYTEFIGRQLLAHIRAQEAVA
jgi:DNA (cytosine-5)-methyltransferase 1